MTRIKTIGFSLKIPWAKLQRLPLSYRIAGRGFLFVVVLLNSLVMPGCIELTNVPVGGFCIDGFCLKEIEMENVRFEPQGLPFSIQPAHVYWLRRGDAIAPRWDTHELHWQGEGAMCGFTDNTSAGDCQVCDFCNPPPSFAGPPCMGTPVFAPGLITVVADSGFIQTDNPQLVLDYTSAQAFAACSNSAGPIGIFEPATSGLYRMLEKEVAHYRGATNGEIKIHVLEKGAGLAQQAAYQLTRQTVDNTNYWTWADVGFPLWLENFSPNMRVTDIRIFRGGCAADPTQGKQCVVPNKMARVKPSRILFLPGFQDTVSGHPEESDFRCYSNPNASDGNFINLDSCRETFTANQTIQKPATPTYLTNSSGGPRPTEKLTWLVEFNTTEGADAVDAADELIIEFTIQAN